MHFMEIPQPGDAVQQAMDIPLYEVPYDKHGQQLCPNRPAGNLDRNKVPYPEYIREKIIEGFHKHTGYSIVSDQGEQEEVEEHIEYIQPELPGPGTLFFFPWPEIFQREEKEGDCDQPVEVVVPRRSRDLMEEVIGITSIGVEEYFEIVL